MMRRWGKMLSCLCCLAAAVLGAGALSACQKEDDPGKDLTLGDVPYRTRTDGTDIRVMSFNILAELWNDRLPVEGRAETVAATLRTYLPDVVGLQEVSDAWYAQLTPLIQKQYTFLYTDNTEGQTNFSTLAYNPETVRVVDKGVTVFSQGNSRQLRLMTWGVFETLQGGKRFAALSTHWDINRSEEPKNEFRLVQAWEMCDLVYYLQNRFDCPVICTGDYNCTRDSEEFQQYARRSGVADAQTDAAQTEGAQYRSTHTVGSMPDTGKKSIDHITYTSGARAVFFALLTDARILTASDHCPILTDFALDAPEV